MGLLRRFVVMVVNHRQRREMAGLAFLGQKGGGDLAPGKSGGE